MLSTFSKSRLIALLGLLSLTTITSSLTAWDCCDQPENRLYIGGFGGGIYSNATRLSQMGTAFFTEAEGGPLAVYAKGRSKKTSVGFGGVQLGYEWSANPHTIGCSDWSITPAAELEAYWFSHTHKGHLINQLSVNRLPEHDFATSFKSNTGVYLVNAVFSLNNSCYSSFTPYVGVGIGASRVSLKNASSHQEQPLEAGINHFNSRGDDSSWAFAAQAKVGLRYNFCGSFHVFGEYRYLFVDSSNYIFGGTDYPTHVPTSPWNVKVNNIQNNAFVFGLQYDL